VLIADSLRYNEKLEIFDLSNNPIGSYSGKSIGIPSWYAQLKISISFLVNDSLNTIGIDSRKWLPGDQSRDHRYGSLRHRSETHCC
jgi:hypothetical protein